MQYLISSPAGILAVLAGIASFFFFLEKSSQWRLFELFPPLLFIYAAPLVCSNTGLIPTESPLYTWMKDAVLPVFLVLMLLNVDVLAAVRISPSYMPKARAWPGTLCKPSPCISEPVRAAVTAAAAISA